MRRRTAARAACREKAHRRIASPLNQRTASSGRARVAGRAAERRRPQEMPAKRLTLSVCILAVRPAGLLDTTPKGLATGVARNSEPAPEAGALAISPEQTLGRDCKSANFPRRTSALRITEPLEIDLNEVKLGLSPTSSEIWPILGQTLWIPKLDR